MKTENLGMAALMAAALLVSPAPVFADGDEAEYEAEADVRVCVISMYKLLQGNAGSYREYVTPYGDPLVDTEYLSIQGDFDDDWLPGGDNPPYQNASGKAKAKSWARAEVISGGVVKWQDLAGDSLGDILVSPYGASIGLGGRSAYSWRYKKDDWDDDDWRKGRRGACGGDELVRVSAKVKGEVAVKRKYGSAQSITDAYPYGFLYIDNNTGQTLTVRIAMDYRYCAEIERAYGANVSARTSIGVEAVGGDPLFDVIEADTSYRSEFCRKGTKYKTIDIPGVFSFQAFQINVNASGSAVTN